MTDFRANQPVRLLVAFLASAERRVGPTPRGAVPACRFLMGTEPLRFLRLRAKPGSCLVADAAGVAWICPTDYLTAAEAGVSP